MNRQTMLSGFQVAVRAAVGATVSVAAAQFCHLQHPLYAMIGAVIVTDLSPAQTRKLGLQRLGGTVVGAACGALLMSAFSPTVWTIGFGVLIAMFLCHLSPARGGVKLAGYLCALVIMSYGQHPWVYALYRLIETMLGIGIAWLISLVPKLIRIEEFASRAAANQNTE